MWMFLKKRISNLSLMQKNDKFAESNLDSAKSQNLIENTLRGSILEIKSGFCETSDKDKTKVYRGSELKQSPILAQKTLAQ